MKNVLVIGSVNMDFFIFGQRVPNPGESLIMESFNKAIGGKGLNQALALKKQGVNTRFQCCIGDDFFSKEINDFLVSVGFGDTVVKKQSDSGVVFIGIDAEGQNTMMVCPNANTKMSINDIPQDTLEWADIIVMQQEIALDTIADVLSYAKKHGKLTVFNAAPAGSINYINCDDVDYLIVNEQEFMTILGIDDFSSENIEGYLNRLQKMGFKNIIFTNGANGVYFYAESQLYFLKSHKVDVLNTVGAGDTFIGTWIAYLIRYNDPIQALKYANVAAAIMISQKKAASDTELTEQIIIEFIKIIPGGSNE